MQLDALQYRLRKAVNAHYALKYPAKGVTNEVAGFEERLAKLQRVQQRLGKQRHHYERLNLKQRLRDNVKEASDLLAGGHRFMAFDIERVMETTVIQEIGGVVFDQEGFKTFHYIIDGAPAKDIPFLFGSSESMSLTDAATKLQEQADGVEFYVGQSLGFDFDVLKANSIRLPRRTFYDTSHWSVLVQPTDATTLSLIELMRVFKLLPLKNHNAGNDAYYAMKVFEAFIKKFTT